MNKFQLKKRIIYLVYLGLLLFPIHISTLNTGITTTPNISEEEINTYSSEIIVKYRIYNGRLQHRRWNVSEECWEDPYWIDD